MFAQNPFAAHTLEILIMLTGAFLFGLWLGWALWGRLKEEIARLRLDNQSANATLDALRLELDSYKTRAVVAETDNSKLATQVVHLNRENASLREKTAFLENELSQTQSRNRQVETELGLSFAPDTPLIDDIPLEIKNIVEQPAAAVEPQEPARVEAPAAAPAPEAALPEEPTLSIEPIAFVEPKAEKPARKTKESAKDVATPAAVTERDDLTVVEGIGPKIQMLLNQYGIQTYRQLAETDVARLKEILSNAGPQLAMHDPGTWPSQANLAANDQWETLKSVQGFLKGGKKPD